MSNETDNEIEKEDTSSELAIEIVDDTPEQDKGRPTKVDVKDVSEEEMDNYSENVKKRFSQLTAKYHAERRSKEAIERENREAIAYAQRIAEENKQLAKLVSDSQKSLVDAARLKTESEIERAKAFYKQAYEAGDADKIVEAQEAVARSVAEHEQWKNYRPVEPRAPQEYVPQQRPQADPKAADWASRNPWFGTDKEMTGTAYGIHERLVRDEGMDPKSDEYYSIIDSEMRKRYPEKFDQDEMPTEQPSRQRVQRASAVAPVSRSVKQPRKVTLTTTQLALAKRLGITPEQYAAQIAKEMQNG